MVDQTITFNLLNFWIMIAEICSIWLAVGLTTYFLSLNVVCDHCLKTVPRKNVFTQGNKFYCNACIGEKPKHRFPYFISIIVFMVLTFAVMLFVEALGGFKF